MNAPVKTELQLFDADTGDTVQTFPTSPNGVFGLAFSPDGRRLVSASGRNPMDGRPTYGEVIVWDVATGLELFRIREKQQSVFGVAISPDGRWLAYGGEGKQVVIHDLRFDPLPEAPPPRAVAR